MMLETYSFQNSILADKLDALDTFAPATFLVWLGQKQFNNIDVEEMFKLYKTYVIEWGKKKKITKQQSVETIRDSYIQVLRELVVNFSTEEEKRFISNCDLSNPSDLDIVLPFFIDKLKQVCLFYSVAREEPKTAHIQHSLRGTNKGLEKLIKKLVFDSAQIDFIVPTAIPCVFPPLSALARDFSVHVEELYDLEEDYFNIPTKTVFPVASSFRASLSAANINIVNSDLYLNFKQAVIEAIQQYPFFVQSLGTNNFVVNPVLSGTEYQYLKNRDFITYLSGGADKLKITLSRFLAPKYLGNDFYYLSTGSSTTSYVSGVLFSVKPLSGAATLNLLNREYPSTATVPSLDSLYTQYQIGGFFLPQHQGLLIHNTPSKYFEVNRALLEPNKVYAFPDPYIAGGDYDVPISYVVDVSWNKRSRSDQFAFGDVLSNSYNQLYYGYESREQDLQTGVEGICKTYDNLQFWEGLKQDKWSDSKVWPGIDKVDFYPLDERQASLLVGDMTPVYWGSDIYGNEYGLLKQANALKSMSGIAYDGSMLDSSESLLASTHSVVQKSIFEKKYTIPGKLYFRNNVTSVVQPASEALSAVFFKYPGNVREELNQSLYYFAMYSDTFIAETDNYVIIDTVIFDYKTDSVVINSNPGTFIKKWKYDKKLEKFAGEWYSESEQALYFCFVTLDPVLSGSNYRRLYPKIFRTKLTDIKLTQVYPSPAADLGKGYSLSANFNDPPQVDLFKIEGISFSRLEKTNLFNLAYLAKNLNSIPMFVNEQIQKNDPYYDTYEPELFKPYYFTYDNNYGNPYLPFFVKYAASSSGVAGVHLPNSLAFEVGQQDNRGVTYLYCDGVKPLQINQIGKFIVQFDWESYNEVGLFLGCNYYKVKNVGNDIVWNATTPNALILDQYDEKTLATTFELFSSYSFETSGVDLSYYVNIGHLVQPVAIGDTEIVVALELTPSLSAGGLSESDLKRGHPYPKRTIVPYSDLVLKIADIFNTQTYMIESYTLGTTAQITLSSISASISAFNINERVYFFNKFNTLETIEYQNFRGTVSAIVTRPVYPDPSVLTFDLITNVPTFTGAICLTDESIYRTIEIVKSGPGTGVVFSDPFCIDCGKICRVPIGYGTELALVASASYFSVFDHWEGTICGDFGASDCIFTVTSSASITAVFDRAQIGTVLITTPTSRVVSTDYGLDVTGPAVEIGGNFRASTIMTLSVQVPVSGWEWRKWRRGPCAGFEPPWWQPDFLCTFRVGGGVQLIEPGFERYFDYQLFTAAIPVSSSVWSTGEIGIIVSNGNGGIGNKTGPINCPNTCYATFTGTRVLSAGGSLVSLTAVPDRGYRIVKWVGSPCEDSAENTDIVVPQGGRLTATNPCSFIMTNDVSVSGYFDIGYYTLTLLVSGNGGGRIYSDQNELINYENGTPASVSVYNILSGTSLTIRASGYFGNEVLGVSSRFCEPNFAIDYCDIRMDEDVTVVVELSVARYYDLFVNFDAACNLGISSSPQGILGGINCSNIAYACSATFGGGSLVRLYEYNNTDTCKVIAFVGDGVIYRYTQGPGININTTTVQMVTGDQLAIIDNSLTLTPEGAPYYGGTGITVTPSDAFVSMTDNRSVSAITIG